MRRAQRSIVVILRSTCAALSHRHPEVRRAQRGASKDAAVATATRAVALRGAAFAAHLRVTGQRRIQISNSHGGSSSRCRAHREGEERGGRRADRRRAVPECRAPLRVRSRLSARRPRQACAVRDLSLAAIYRRRAALCLHASKATHGVSQLLAGVRSDPGRSPGRRPGAGLRSQPAGRRTSLRSIDASRERPSMSEVKMGILAYRNFVKKRFFCGRIQKGDNAISESSSL